MRLLTIRDPLAAVLPRITPAKPSVLGATSLQDPFGIAPVPAMARLANRAADTPLVRVNDRQRVELAIPGRLMIPWVEVFTDQNKGIAHVLSAIKTGFIIDIERCMAGCDPKVRAKLIDRAQREADEAMRDLLFSEKSQRPSPLTGFMTCSFAWQMLIQEGKLELEENSLFYNCWDELAGLVAMARDLETLQKVRKSALKRAETLVASLKAKGYYS